MATASDITGNDFTENDIVNIPCKVISVGGQGAVGVPLLTLQSKYKDANGNLITISTIYATQVMVAK